MTVNAFGTAELRLRRTNGTVYRQFDTNPGLYDIITNYSMGAFYSPNALASANVQNAAVVKALNSISQAKASLGQDLATYLQTVRMFGSKTALLVDSLKALKEGKLAKYIYDSASDILKKGDKVAAQAYLEYVYGWKPLVEDIYGTYLVLKRYASGDEPIIIHGHGSQTQRSNSQKPIQTSTFKTLLNSDETYKGTCDLYACVDPQYAALRALNQLGLLNPAEILWDITPWSFVVDWVIPIGPVLTAFMAPIGLNFVSGTQAVRFTRNYSGDYHSYVNSPLPVLTDRSLSYTANNEGYIRSVLANWPLPMPYVNLNPLTGDRWLKALALVIANLR
jgi:hypothetical protein